jgi:hypothetical protein
VLAALQDDGADVKLETVTKALCAAVNGERIAIERTKLERFGQCSRDTAELK